MYRSPLSRSLLRTVPRRARIAALAISTLVGAALAESTLVGNSIVGAGALRAAEPSHVSWTVTVEPARVAPGGEVAIKARYELADGWHLYAPDHTGVGKPTTLLVEGTHVSPAGDPTFPSPVEVAEPILGGTQRFLEGSGEIVRRVQIAAGAPVGDLTLRVTLDWMTCDERHCDPPASREVTRTVTVAAAAGEGSPTAPEGGPVEGGRASTEAPPAGTSGAPVDSEGPPESADSPSSPVVPGLPLPGMASPVAPGSGAAADVPRVEWKVTAEPRTLRRGGRGTIVARFELEEGWHLYAPDHTGVGVPTEISLDSQSLELDADALFPTPRVETIPGLEGEQRYLEGAGEIRRPFTVSTAASPGPLSVAATIAYMTCTDRQCSPPLESRHTLSMEISSEPPLAPAPDGTGAPVDGAGAPIDGAGEALEASGEPTGEIARRSIWTLILLMISGGFFALVMPCTYPMIPITFSFFTKQAEARGGSVLPLALAYGVGIILSFNIVGLVFAGVIIDFATNAWLNLLFGVAFFAFALSFFGLFEIALPASVTGLATRAAGASGYLGVFLLGATLCITSFTCTAPIIGSLLIYAVEGGSTSRVVIGMTAFGLTMAAPFVLLAMAPARVRSMPRSGEWMHTVKVFLGFLELAAALKFLSNADLKWEFEALPREPFLAMWAGIFGVCGLYLLGLVRLRDERAEGVSGVRMLVGTACVTGALYFLLGTTGWQLDRVTEALAPPYSSRRAVPTAGEGETARRAIVVDDVEEGFRLARERGQKALVHFTGHLCVNCRQMERFVFPKHEDLLSRYVEIRLHTDTGEKAEELMAYQIRMTRSQALPQYLIVDPADPDEVLDEVSGAFPEEFASLLERNLD